MVTTFTLSQTEFNRQLQSEQTDHVHDFPIPLNRTQNAAGFSGINTIPSKRSTILQFNLSMPGPD